MREPGQCEAEGGQWGQTRELQLQPGCIRVAWAAAVAGIGASGDSGETNTDFSDCPPPGERGPAVRGEGASVIQHQFCIDGRQTSAINICILKRSFQIC